VIHRIVAVGLACMTMSSTPALAADRPNLAAYGALPNIESIEISPDGAKLAAVVSDGEKRGVAIRKITGELMQTIVAGSAKVRGLEWAGPNHLLVMMSESAQVEGVRGPRREYMTAIDVNLATGRQTRLLEEMPQTMNVVVGWPMPRTIDNQPVVFVEGIAFVGNVGRNTLFRINLDTYSTRVLTADGDKDTDGWLVDSDGRPVAQSIYDNKRGLWSLKVRNGASWRTIDEAPSAMGSYGLAGFGRDGRSVLVWRTDDRNDVVLREYNLDGSREDLLGDIGLSGLIHDPRTLALIGGYKLDGDDLRYTFFDDRSQRAWNAVAKALGDSRPRLVSWSQDRQKIVIEVDSRTEGLSYLLIDLETPKAEPLGAAYLGLSAQMISPVRSIKYKAADGLEISGYLTLPKGRDPRNLPLIVLPHGGPEGRDTPGFDWWSQALASRGYAVLQPNFRGSEGFGWDFIKAGFGEWGRKMQTDLSDGVRDLAKQGIVDPKRVCIVGGSYGGYAALAGATLDTGVYRCAVSVAGPSDLKKMLLSVRDAHNGEMSAAQRYWLRFMGADGIKDPDLVAISPAKLADKVEIPILLIHGKDDTVVRYDQSQAMADALKKAGKPVAFFTLDGEDHWLSRGATRLKMLTETVTFVEKHNPPD